jgi:hypothetical protein
MMWEMDYPHSDSTWPDAPEQLWRCIGDLPDEDIEKISHRNAMACFNFDPFAHRPKERCTVRALRAEASDVDIETKSMGRRKADADAGALAARLAAVASKGAPAATS